MRICLIFNPKAGTADHISEFLLQLTGDHRCELRPTTADGDARRIAEEALQEGFTRIVVAGGDGTIGQVVNGLSKDFAAVELAILPIGTGNDLVRLLDISPDKLPQACKDALGDRVHPIDLIRVTSNGETSYCVNVANGGLGGQVAIDVRGADKQLWGPMAYWMTSISRLVDVEPYAITLTMDETKLELQSCGTAIANGRFVGGGFPIAPHALLNDGWLDITTVPALSILELTAAGANFVLSRDNSDQRVQTYRARSVTLRAVPEMPFSIDGEPTRRLDARFEILPRVLRIVSGANPEGLAADQ